MKIDEYKKISDNVQVPDVVWEGYQNAIAHLEALLMMKIKITYVYCRLRLC